MGLTSAYGYPANSHRLTTLTGSTRSYDAAGNTTFAPQLPTPFLNYDVRNRLIAASPYAEQDLVFDCNGKGERVSKGWVGGKFTATRYLYNESGAVVVYEDSNPAQETPSSKAIIYIDQLPVGVIDDKSP